MRTVQDMLNTIRDAGYTDAQIGESVDTPQATIYRLRVGDHQSTDYQRYSKIETFCRKVEAATKRKLARKAA